MKSKKKIIAIPLEPHEAAAFEAAISSLRNKTNREHLSRSTIAKYLMGFPCWRPFESAVNDVRAALWESLYDPHYKEQPQGMTSEFQRIYDRFSPKSQTLVLNALRRTSEASQAWETMLISVLNDAWAKRLAEAETDDCED